MERISGHKAPLVPHVARRRAVYEAFIHGDPERMTYQRPGFLSRIAIKACECSRWQVFRLRQAIDEVSDSACEYVVERLDIS